MRYVAKRTIFSSHAALPIADANVFIIIVGSNVKVMSREEDDD